MSAIASDKFEALRRTAGPYRPQDAVGLQWNLVTPQAAPQSLVVVSGAVQSGQLGVTPRATAPQWLISALRALARLAGLPNNWDGYGSPPLRPAALRAAHRLVKMLEQLPLPVPQVSPVTGGGISFTWQLASRELAVEILPDGSAQYLVVVTDPETAQEASQEEPLPLDRPESGQALAAWLISG